MKIEIKGRKADFPAKEGVIFLIRTGGKPTLTLKLINRETFEMRAYNEEGNPVGYINVNPQKLNEEEKRMLADNANKVILLPEAVTGTLGTDIICEVSFGEENVKEVGINSDLNDKLDMKYLKMAKKVGMSEKDAKIRIRLMRDKYGLNEENIYKVCSFWEKPATAVKNYIPGIDKIIYQDNAKHIFKRVMGHIVNGTNAVRIVGAMSTGKNVFIESMAAILYKPLLDVDMQRNTEAEDFEGRDTLGFKKIAGDTLVSEEELKKSTFVDKNTLSPYESATLSAKQAELQLLYAKMKNPQIIQTLEFIKQPLTIAMENGCWINFNELNFAQPHILARLHRVLDTRASLYIPSIGEVKAKKGFAFMATMNPPKDSYVGVSTMNEAFESRMMTVCLEPTESIKQLLSIKYPEADIEEINQLDTVYKQALNSYRSGDLSEAFLSVRRYEAALTEKGFGDIMESIEDHVGSVSCNDEEQLQRMQDIISVVFR